MERQIERGYIRLLQCVHGEADGGRDGRCQWSDAGEFYRGVEGSGTGGVFEEGGFDDGDEGVCIVLSFAGLVWGVG